MFHGVIQIITLAQFFSLRHGVVSVPVINWLLALTQFTANSSAITNRYMAEERNEKKLN